MPGVCLMPASKAHGVWGGTGFPSMKAGQLHLSTLQGHRRDKCWQVLRCRSNHTYTWIGWLLCCPEAAVCQLETPCMEGFCFKANSATANDIPMGLRDATPRGALTAGFETLLKERVLVVMLVDGEQRWRTRRGSYLLLVMRFLESRLQPWDSTGTSDFQPR